MTAFALLTRDSAPAAAKPLLDNAIAAYGAIPNLFAIMARSPALLSAYQSMDAAFATSSFTPIERQIILLTVSRLNGCRYCVAAHSTVAKMAGMPAEWLQALRAGATLPDAKAEALRRLAAVMVDKRGWASAADLAAFFAAGFDARAALDLVLGIGLKTLSNYVNHIAQTPLDAMFAAERWDQTPAAAGD